MNRPVINLENKKIIDSRDLYAFSPTNTKRNLLIKGGMIKNNQYTNNKQNNNLLTRALVPSLLKDPQEKEDSFTQFTKGNF
jgi:hypothetical protein